MSSKTGHGGGQPPSVEQFEWEERFVYPREVAAFIGANFPRKPEARIVLTPTEYRQWLNAVIGIRASVIKQCDAVMANRDDGIDNVKKAMMGMLSSMDIRRNLVVLNDRTMDMIDIAHLAEVELFTPRATVVMYSIFGK